MIQTVPPVDEMERSKLITVGALIGSLFNIQYLRNTIIVGHRRFARRLDSCATLVDHSPPGYPTSSAVIHSVRYAVDSADENSSSIFRSTILVPFVGKAPNLLVTRADARSFQPHYVLTGQESKGMVVHEEPTNIRVSGKYRVLNFHRVAILDSDTGTSIAIHGALALKNSLPSSIISSTGSVRALSS